MQYNAIELFAKHLFSHVYLLHSTAVYNVRSQRAYIDLS
jgi:hypothetical protein